MADLTDITLKNFQLWSSNVSKGSILHLVQGLNSGLNVYM